jgi:hypothetical protein
MKLRLDMVGAGKVLGLPKDRINGSYNQIIVFFEYC